MYLKNIESVVVFLIVFIQSSVASVSIASIYKTRSASTLPGGMTPIVSDSVTSAVALALEHCQKVFKWDKWNCTGEEFARLSEYPATREAAFTKAILAAAVVHSITKNCSRGEIRDCSCSAVYEGQEYGQYYKRIGFFNQSNTTPVNGSDGTTRWSWGGCSDDPTFGYRVVRELFENHEKSNSVSAFIGKHNFRVGRQVVHQTMVKNCRCHGVSGSCTLKSCWIQVAPFREIARKLREKYNKANRIAVESVEASITLTNNIKREDRDLDSPASEHALVYIEQSPDYCVANVPSSWPGTKGRVCSKRLSPFATKAERKSCRNICRQCGHKVKKQKRTVQKMCNCKFQWCCTVKCDICLELVEDFYCV